MLPFHAPAGTTPRDYLLTVVPEAHRSLVPASTAGKRWEIAIHVPGDLTVVYAIDGGTIEATESRDADAHLALTLEKDHVSMFLEDWAGPRKWAPKFEPRGAALVTDPRVVSRVALVTGSVEATVPGLNGITPRLVISAFGGKRKTLERDELERKDCDVAVSLGGAVFESLLAGKMGPDDALSSGDVGIRGKKLVAMQYAFALAPFFPAK